MITKDGPDGYWDDARPEDDTDDGREAYLGGVLDAYLRGDL